MEDHEFVLNKLKDKAPIVSGFNGFIILAQDESDYKSKEQKILNGDRDGFYTLDKLKAQYFIN
jgi:hypothetical protein